MIKKTTEYHHGAGNQTTTGTISSCGSQTEDQKLLEMCQSLKDAGLRLKTLEQRLKTAAVSLHEAAQNLHIVSQDVQITEQAAGE